MGDRCPGDRWALEKHHSEHIITAGTVSDYINNVGIGPKPFASHIRLLVQLTAGLRLLHVKYGVFKRHLKETCLTQLSCFVRGSSKKLLVNIFWENTEYWFKQQNHFEEQIQAV